MQREKEKEDDRETRGAMSWKQTSKKPDTPGGSWRDLAQDQSAWRSHVGGLCPRRGDKDFDWLLNWKKTESRFETTKVASDYRRINPQRYMVLFVNMGFPRVIVLFWGNFRFCCKLCHLHFWWMQCLPAHSSHTLLSWKSEANSFETHCTISQRFLSFQTTSAKTSDCTKRINDNWRDE